MSGTPNPNLPYPPAASPSPTSVGTIPPGNLPSTDPNAPAGTNAPVTAPAAPPVPDLLAKEGTATEQSAFKADAVIKADAAKLQAAATTGQTSGTAFDAALAAILAGQTTTAIDPTVAAGDSAYQQIWGVTPPKGYIERLVKDGLNSFQITLHELGQPGASSTQYYRDNAANYASSIAKLMGRRP
jgi:hypothetical protein